MRNLLKNIVDALIKIECTLYSRNIKKSKSVLIFRKDGLGDYILMYPFLKYFRRYYSDYKISLVVPKIATGLLPLLKDFDDIIEYDTRKFSSNIFYRRSFFKNISHKGYEIAIYPVYSREAVGDMAIQLTGAIKKIGFAVTHPTRRDLIYTDLVSVPPKIVSEIERNAYFTQKCTGINTEVVFPTIDVRFFDDTNAKRLLDQNRLTGKKFCVIFPDAGAYYKKWPEERFSIVCDYIISQNIIPVICGSSTNMEGVEQIIHHTNHKNIIVNLVGDTDIPALVHILHRSIFYFGNDTGIMHLAAAIDIPVIGIMGGGHFGRFFPYGNLGRNLYIYDKHMTCKNDNWHCVKHHEDRERAPCIVGITVGDAIEKVTTLLAHIEQKA